MKFIRTTMNRETKVELREDGEIYVDDVCFNSLSIYLWDAIRDHLVKGGPLSYMDSEFPGHDRRIKEAQAAAKVTTERYGRKK